MKPKQREQCTSPLPTGRSTSAVVSARRQIPDDPFELSFPREAAFSSSSIFFLVCSFASASSLFITSEPCQRCHSAKQYRRSCFRLNSVASCCFLKDKVCPLKKKKKPCIVLADNTNETRPKKFLKCSILSCYSKLNRIIFHSSEQTLIKGINSSAYTFKKKWLYYLF